VFSPKTPHAHRFFALMVMNTAEILRPPTKGNEREQQNEPERQSHDVQRRLVNRRIDELHPHPSYARNGLTVPSWKLDALARRGDLAFLHPLAITHTGTIIDGCARLNLAILQKRTTLECIEYELTDEEALQLLLQMQCRSSHLNSFCRILLALDLEPWLKEKARANQRFGGQHKGSSNLTEAGRVDVRGEIAQAADVCEANVSKVKQLKITAQPEILQALRNGEVQIHRAWKWSKQSPQKQVEALRIYRCNKGIGKKIRHLISRHSPSTSLTAFDPSNLFSRLSAFSADELSSVRVSVVKASGKAVFVTEELVQALESQEELFAWAAKSH
jgi:hypothetical protein